MDPNYPDERFTLLQRKPLEENRAPKTDLRKNDPRKVDVEQLGLLDKKSTKRSCIKRPEARLRSPHGRRLRYTEEDYALHTEEDKDSPLKSVRQKSV